MADIFLHRNVMFQRINLDASGLLCPLPVLKLKKRLAGLDPGDHLTMITTDPAAAIDVPHFCNESGHELVEQAEDGKAIVFTIRCRPKP